MSSQVVPSITALFAHRGPSHVAGLVSAFVINSIERCSLALRLRADVRNEGAEVVDPLGADTNASTAVVWIIPGLLVSASFLGLLPSAVFRRVASCVAVAESWFTGTKFTGVRSRSAATRERAPGSEMSAANDANTAAIAPAFPSIVPAVASTRRFADDNQSPESSADHWRLVTSRLPHDAILSRAPNFMQVFS